MKVILDSNVFVSQHFLKGHLGIVLIQALRNTGAELVLPESTLREAKKQTLRVASERRAEIDSATSQLEVLIGKRPNIMWPSDLEIAEAIDRHLRAIDDVLQHKEIDLTVVRAALARVIEKRAPAHRKEEFRDALLWETALSLAHTDLVHLVTSDGDFLAEKDGKKRLHSVLAGEVAAEGVQLEHHLNLAELLTALGREAQEPDRAAITLSLSDYLKPQLLEDTHGRGLVIGDQREAAIQAFATPNPNVLAVSFDIGFEASVASPASSSSTEASINASGSANLDPRTHDVRDLQLDRVDMGFPSGSTESNRGIVYLRGSPSLPRSWRSYEFRQPLGVTDDDL